MYKAPEQALYDAMFSKIKALDCNVYTHNPPPSAKYPFAVLGMIQIVPFVTKTQLLARIHAVITVWGDANDRYAVSSTTDQIMRSISQIHEADGFIFRLDMTNSNYSLMPDQSTNDDLWRSDITLEFTMQ